MKSLETQRFLWMMTVVLCLMVRYATFDEFHLSSRFSVTMEPHCALKTRTHLLKNRSCYHHNANDRFGLNSFPTAFRHLFFSRSVSSVCCLVPPFCMVATILNPL